MLVCPPPTPTDYAPVRQLDLAYPGGAYVTTVDSSFAGPISSNTLYSAFHSGTLYVTVRSSTSLAVVTQLALPPPPPFAPPLPPFVPQPVASFEGDPHAKGADGEAFHFRGVDNATFCILSAANLGFNALFNDVAYRATWSKRNLEGSFIKAAFWTLRSPRRLVQIEFRSSVAVIRETGRPLQWIKLGGAPYVADDVQGLRVSVTRGKTYLSHLCTVTTRNWKMSAESCWTEPHRGIVRLRLKIQPRLSLGSQAVAPHGLLGQTYDGDGLPLFGREDDYASHSRTFRTSAQGEGGIEGKAEDYRVAEPFGTAWRFSRFDATSGRPRNASLLRADRSSGAVRFCLGTNLQGGDLRSVLARDAPTQARCYDECMRLPECSAFTHITTPGVIRRCWLKRVSSTKHAAGAGVVSAAVRGELVGRCDFQAAHLAAHGPTRDGLAH